MENSPIIILANYVNALMKNGDFQIVDEIDGNYNHMGALVADAVLQANLRYETHVKPRVKSILATYPEATTTSALINLLNTIPTTVFLSWRGIDRANRFDEVVRLFKSENIETEKDIYDRFTSLQSKDFADKLRSIKGIGPKTVDYLKILAGLPESAIDRHLVNFLGEAGIHSTDYKEVQSIINGVADHLKIDRSIFDHSIWTHMSTRAKASPRPVCKGV